MKFQNKVKNFVLVFWNKLITFETFSIKLPQRIFYLFFDHSDTICILHPQRPQFVILLLVGCHGFLELVLHETDLLLQIVLLEEMKNGTD